MAQAFQRRATAVQAQAQGPNAERKYALAEAARLRAIEIWERLAQQFPDYGPDARLLQESERSLAQLYADRGEWYLNQGTSDKALADLDRAVTLDESAPWHFMRRASIYRRQGKFDQAMADYDRVIALGDTVPWVYHERGDLHMALGHGEKALEDYDAALARQPGNYYALRRRGSALAFLGRCEAALKDYESCLELQPLSTEVWEPYVLVNWRTHGIAAYRKACAQLIEKHGKMSHPMVWNSLAWICAFGPNATQNLDERVALSRRAVTASPKNYAFLNTLGAILYRAGDYEGAVKELEQAVDVHGRGGTWTDWVFLTLTHRQLKHTDEAARCWENAVRLMEVSTNAVSASDVEATPLPWHEQVLMNLLREETEAVMAEAK